MSSQQYDFVAIGDITIDAFIQLSKNDATVSKDQKTGRKNDVSLDWVILAGPNSTGGTPLESHQKTSPSKA